MRREHPEDQELLLALDGELDCRRHAAVDAHLSECRACRSRLAEMQSTLDETTRLLQSRVDTLPASPDSGRARLEHALREAAEERERQRLARVRDTLASPPARAVFGAAAAVVLAVWMSGSDGVSQGTRQQRGTERSSLPLASLTPGAVSGLTAPELCSGARPSKLVTVAAKQRVLRDYRMENVPEQLYELDALITPELGGTTDAANLWPQRYESPVWNARVKDRLEHLLPELVCSNQLELAQAQRDLAADWVAAYKRYFRTDAPLRAHLLSPFADDDELEYAPVGYVVAKSDAIVPLIDTFIPR